MSSILPKIEAISQIHQIHEQYAQAVLKLVIEKLLSMEEFGIGTFSTNNEVGSIISFDGDDFEDTNLELCYTCSKFILKISEHGQEFDQSLFIYKIFQETFLYQMIPEKLIKAMKDVADKEKPTTFKVGKRLSY